MSPANLGAGLLNSLCVSVLEQVQHDVKDAMKAREKERVHALRLIASELQKAEKDQSGDEVQVLQRERKRRLEAAEAYRDGGRDEQAESEEREAEIIASYMPEQLSDEHVIDDALHAGHEVLHHRGPRELPDRRTNGTFDERAIERRFPGWSRLRQTLRLY